MQVKHSLTVPFARDAVWVTLQDIEAVAACVPGAKLDGPPANGALSGSMAVKLGPIQAQFAGTGTVTMDAAAQAGTLSGSGSDRKSGSRAKGSAGFALVPEGDITRIDLTLDYELTGALAQFGRIGIVQDLVGRIAQQFAANLANLIGSRQPAAPEAPPAPPPPAPVEARLDLLALLRGAIADWFRRLLGRAQSPR
jgi:carbon monoxide dehydrogenase subunit G